MDVLLIDDNKEITEMVSFFLDSQNITCNIENEGKNALEKIKNKKYDMILLDLTMPFFSGYDIFENLKKEDLLKKNNIVLFTASYLPEGKIEQMIKEGAKGIIKKTISINTLIEIINKYK